MNLRDGPAGWDARLELEFSASGERTVFSHRRHSGPLLVQKPFYPEDPAVCHATLVHPPGGIAGGDRLEVHVRISRAAHAVVTTPGAAKWYKSPGLNAEFHSQIEIEDDAVCEWLPQPSIVFNGAQGRQSHTVRLARNARYIGWDIWCLGRVASGERFAQGQFKTRSEILGTAHRIWNDAAIIRGGDGLLSAPAGLNGQPVSGLFLAAGGEIERGLIDRCRAIACEAPARSGVTALPLVLAARYIGESTEAAFRYFTALWNVVRPVVAGRIACAPRIWQT